LILTEAITLRFNLFL